MTKVTSELMYTYIPSGTARHSPGVDCSLRRTLRATPHARRLPQSGRSHHKTNGSGAQTHILGEAMEELDGRGRGWVAARWAWHGACADPPRRSWGAGRGRGERGCRLARRRKGALGPRARARTVPRACTRARAKGEGGVSRTTPLTSPEPLPTSKAEPPRETSSHRVFTAQRTRTTRSLLLLPIVQEWESGPSLRPLWVGLPPEVSLALRWALASARASANPPPPPPLPRSSLASPPSPQPPPPFLPPQPPPHRHLLSNPSPNALAPHLLLTPPPTPRPHSSTARTPAVPTGTGSPAGLTWSGTSVSTTTTGGGRATGPLAARASSRPRR